MKEATFFWLTSVIGLFAWLIWVLSSSPHRARRQKSVRRRHRRLRRSRRAKHVNFPPAIDAFSAQ